MPGSVLFLKLPVGAQDEGSDALEAEDLAAVHSLGEVVALVGRKFVHDESSELPEAAPHLGEVLLLECLGKIVVDPGEIFVCVHGLMVTRGLEVVNHHASLCRHGSLIGEGE